MHADGDKSYLTVFIQCYYVLGRTKFWNNLAGYEQQKINEEGEIKIKKCKSKSQINEGFCVKNANLNFITMSFHRASELSQPFSSKEKLSLKASAHAVTITNEQINLGHNPRELSGLL